MTVVNPDSIAGITSVTSSGTTLEFYDVNGNLLDVSANLTGELTVGTGATISSPGASIIDFETNGSERLRIGSSGQIGIAGANYGSSGQVLTSAGSGSAVTWSAIPTQVTLNNNADNRVITGGSGVNLNGESSLTFDGSLLNLTGDLAISTANRIYFGNSDVAFIKGEHGGSGYLALGANTEHVRITRAGKLGVGVASPVSILHLHEAGSNGAPIIQFSNGDTGTTTGDGFAIGMADNESPFIYNRENTDLRIATNNTERLRIKNDGVVNIGANLTQTTYPFSVQKDLDSGGNLAYFANSDSTYNQGLTLSFDSNKDIEWSGGSGSGGMDWNMGTRGYVWRAQGTEQLRLTCSSGKGQLDLGGGMGRDFTHLFDMHPFTNPAGALFNYNKNNLYLSQNIFFTGQWQLDQAAAGSYFHQSGGGFTFNTAPSGSANAATSVYKILGVEPNEIVTGLNYGNRPSYKGNLVLFGDSHTTQHGGIEFHTSGGGGAGYGSRITANSGGDLRFLNRSNNSAWTETINMGAGHIQFGISPNSTLWDSNSNEQGLYYRRAEGSFAMATRSSTGYSNWYMNKNTTNGNSDNRYIDFYWNSTSRGSITNSGGSSTSYNTSSDYRLKENIVDITDGITRLKQLKPRRFNWIHDSTNTIQDGFIAHEVSSLIPEAVTGTKDRVVTQAEVDADTQPQNDAAGTPVYQQMDYAKVTPLLTAALQELITKVESIEAQQANDAAYEAKIDKIIDYFKL